MIYTKLYKTKTLNLNLIENLAVLINFKTAKITEVELQLRILCESSLLIKYGIV